MPKQRPILFSAPMVRAILAGTKTQTRRVVRIPSRGAFVVRDDGDGWWPYESDDGESVLCNDSNEYPMPPPYGGTGDRLWVRETFAPDYFGAGKPGYRADWTARAADVCPEPRWKPSIFMRRQDSRITLNVTALRVERLQEITPGEVLAEGVPEVPRCGCDVCRRLPAGAFCPADAGAQVQEFAGLWDSINGKRPGCAWADNPWVWVVSFRRLSGSP